MTFSKKFVSLQPMEIRTVKLEDAPQLLAIYAPYVKHTAITFEYDVPTEDEFLQRIADISSKYPYLVATTDGRIVGYAYANVFKNRPAYQWSVETSIYVDKKEKRKGIGRKLHESLEKALQEQGIQNMNACISYVESEDEYLTLDSVRFHEHLGYQQVAHFHQCGRKFNRWYDIIWMEKMIGNHNSVE